MLSQAKGSGFFRVLWVSMERDDQRAETATMSHTTIKTRVGTITTMNTTTVVQHESCYQHYEYCYRVLLVY